MRAIKVRLTGWHPLSAPFIQDASAEGDGAIRVYWFSGTLTAGLTGYRVEFRSGPGGWRTLVDLDASAMTSGLLEYLHTGLEHGQEYFYRVRALSTGGPGLPSEALRATAVTSEDEDPGLNLPYGPAELLFGNSHQYSSYVSGNGVLRLADPDDSYLFPTVMRVAQGFRTGPNPRGYRLNAISLSVGRHDYDNQVGRIWRIDVKKVAEPLDPSLTHDEVEPTLEPLTLDFPSGAQVKSRPHPERRNGKLRFGRLDFDLDPNSYYYLIIDNVRGPQSLPAYYGQWELAATPDAARGRGRHLSRVPFFGLDGWSLMPYGLWIASQVARDELFNWSHFGEAETLGSGLKLTLHGQAHRAPIVEQTTGLLVYDMGRQLRQLRWNPSSIDGLRTRYTIQVDSGTPSCSDDAGWSDLVVTQEPSIALQTDRNCLRVRDQQTSDDAGYSDPTAAVRAGTGHAWLLTGNHGRPGALRRLTGERAQAFRTGPHQIGYLLRGVVLDLANTRAGDMPSVRLHADDDGVPGELLTQLSGVGPARDGPFLFAPRVGQPLTASTVYHLVVTDLGQSRLTAVADSAEDPGGAAGFTLADQGQHRAGGSASWTAGGAPLRIELAGLPRTRPGQPRDLRAIPSSPASAVLRWEEDADGDELAPDGHLLEHAEGDRPWLTAGQFGPSEVPLSARFLAGGERHYFRISSVRDGLTSEPSEIVSVFPMPASFGSETLLSSLEPAGSEELTFFEELTEDRDNNFEVSQRFTTGPNTGGYAVERVTLDFAAIGTGRVRSLQLRKGGNAGSVFDTNNLVAEFHYVSDDWDESAGRMHQPGRYRFSGGGAPALLEPEAEYYLFLVPEFDVSSGQGRTVVLKLADSNAATDREWVLDSRYTTKGFTRLGQSAPIVVKDHSGQLAMSLEGASLDAPNRPRGLQSSLQDGQDRHEFRLTWQPPSSEGSIPVTGYELQRTRTPRVASSWRTVRELDGYHKNLAVDSPAAEGVYSYRVRALTRVGRSAWTNPVQIERIYTPFPPSLTAQAVPGAPGTLELTWEPGREIVRAPDTGYAVESSVAGISWQEITFVRAPGTSHTVEDLTPGEQRYFRVIASNRNGPSEPSNVVGTASLQRPAPSPPSGLSAAADTNDPTTVLLSWCAPHDDGGSELSAYRVEFSQDLGISWQLRAVVSPPWEEETLQTTEPGCPMSLATVYRDTGVAAGAAYSYRVRAVTAFGRSEPSRAASPSLLGALPLQTVLATSMQVGRSARSDADGDYTVQGYRTAASGGPAQGSLARRSFAFAGRRYLVAALILTAKDGGAQEDRFLDLRLEPDGGAGDPPRLGRVSLQLGANGQRFELSEAEATHERDASRYRWPAGDLELEENASVEVRFYAPLLARTRADAPVLAEIAPDGRWQSFQLTPERVSGVEALYFRTWLDVDHQYRVEFRMDTTGLTAFAIEQQRHPLLVSVGLPNGRFEYARDAGLFLDEGYFLPGGRQIEFRTDSGSNRIAGEFYVTVDTPNGFHPSAAGSRFWIRVVGSTEGIEQRSHSEGSRDFPADQSTRSPGRIILGDPVTGRADPRHDAGDQFRVALDAGVPYLLRALGESRPVLSIQREGRSRNELAGEADTIIYTPARSETHYVGVRHRSTSGDQRYRIEAAPLGISEPSWLMALTPGRSGDRTGYPGGCAAAATLSTTLSVGGPPGLSGLEHEGGRLSLDLGAGTVGDTLLRYTRGSPDQIAVIEPETRSGNPVVRAWQRFRTGSGPAADWQSILLHLGSVDPGDALRVSVHADDQGRPAATALFILERADGQALVNGRNEFVAPENAPSLSACTTYHLVFERTQGDRIEVSGLEHLPSDGILGYESRYGWTLGSFIWERKEGNELAVGVLWIQVTGAPREAAGVSDFDWLVVGGAAFRADEAQVSESSGRYEWPAADPPWTVGRQVETRFYGEGESSLWSAVLQPGRATDGQRSGYPAGGYCDPQGEWFNLPGGFGRPAIAALEHEQEPGRLTMTLRDRTIIDSFSGGASQAVAITASWPRLVQPFLTGPQSDIDLDFVVIGLGPTTASQLAVSIESVRVTDGEREVVQLYLLELDRDRSTGTQSTFRLRAGQGALEPHAWYQLVLTHPGGSTQLDGELSARNDHFRETQCRLATGWRMGDPYLASQDDSQGAPNVTSMLPLRLVNESGVPDGQAELDRLVVGEVAFAVSEATLSEDGQRYVWTVAEAPWSDAEPVGIWLRGARPEPEAPPTGRLPLRSRSGQYCAEEFAGGPEPPPAQRYCPGQTLLPDRSGVAGAEGRRLSYQWYRIEDGLRLEIPGAQSEAYEITTADVGRRLLVRAHEPRADRNWETDPTEPIVRRPNHPATGSLEVRKKSSDPQASEHDAITAEMLLLQGETLIAVITEPFTDPDGLSSPVYRYQWFRHEPAGDPEGTPISGATSHRYALRDSDSGQRISVRVSFSDDLEQAERVRSPRTPRRTRIEALLVARARGLPTSHQGEKFRFELSFSEDVTIGFEALKRALEIQGGTVTRARRVAFRDDQRLITVAPNENGRGEDIIISLAAGPNCEDQQGEIVGICTEAGQRLQDPLELSVPGPAGQSDGRPGAPRRLEFASDDADPIGFFGVSWQRPFYHGDRAIEHYVIQWKPAANEYDAGTFTVVEFPPEDGELKLLIDAAVTYTARAAARNARGLGAWSNEITFELEGSPPGASTGLSAVATPSGANYQRITLSWTAPADANAATLSYIVQARYAEIGEEYPDDSDDPLFGGGT